MLASTDQAKPRLPRVCPFSTGPAPPSCYTFPPLYPCANWFVTDITPQSTPLTRNRYHVAFPSLRSPTLCAWDGSPRPVSRLVVLGVFLSITVSAQLHAWSDFVTHGDALSHATPAVTDGEAWLRPQAWSASPAEIPGIPDASVPGRRNRALELVQRTDSEGIRRYKKGFFQRLSFAAEWIDPSGDSGLGVTNLKTSTTVAIPLGSSENLLLVTPSFEVALIDADPTVDIPDRLYNTGVDFMWRKQFNDRWGTMIAVTPGYSSDFQNSENAIRIRGRGLATWQWVPERLTLLFGVVYLDRNDLPLLPGAGLIWTPTPDWRVDLLFPRPKLAYRCEFVPGSHENWVYLNGQLGGRTWSVERSDGSSDELTLRDYRLALGWERIVDGGGGLFAEIGLSFGRELEYEIDPLEMDFEDAVFLRGGVTF